MIEISRYKFLETFVLLGAKLLLLRAFFYGGIAVQGLPAEWLSVLALLCLLELVTPARVKWGVYLAFNLIMSLVFFAATVYFAYFGTVPTYAVLSGLNQVPEVKASVASLLRPEQFLYFLDILVLVVIRVAYALSHRRRGDRIVGLRYMKGLSFRTDRLRKVLWRKAAVLSALVVSLLLSSLYINIGKGIDNELVRAESVGFFNFQVDAAIRNQEEERMIAAGNLQETVIKLKEWQSSYPYRAVPGQNSPYFGAAEGMNVIVVQLESFQNFPIHLQIEGQEVTPVLNELAQAGVYFPQVYQQIGPGNTSDAEFMSNTSIYPTATAAMSTSFGDRELPSLPRLLQAHGYAANTFHINDVSFWDRNRLYPALNFDQYYDKPFYTNDHFNDFGASDEEMYRVGVEKLSELKVQSKPFYAQFVTTSSHNPFVVPEDQRHIKLPADLEGTMLGNYITAINYTDYAIGTLIERLKEAGMWDNTVLVFYGDHFGLQEKDVSAAEIQAKLGIAYDERISRFNIPLLIHVPGQVIGEVSPRTGGQVDILPTIASLLGISLEDEGFVALGQDLLSVDRNVVGMRYYLPTGSFFNDEVMFVPGAGFDDGTAVSLDTLQPVTELEPYRSDYEYITELMRLSDEYVKLLPKRAPGH
ncbi:LTA synthase family protein [Paenibacillus sanguinis]|uniref:LTA synthase family protein n=1 Tax=Paenibacillus sanguinis TaxID=225906 RepID=UPI000381945C|nr:LTA synthase family protein [Paenibacillus sanguinis]